MIPQEKWNQYKAAKYHDMTDYMDYLRSVARGNVFEIGVRDGVSTACFLMGLNDKKEGHLYSVDTNPHCRKAITDKRWTFIHAKSERLATPDFPIDVLMIDGCHTYQATITDLLRFGWSVKPGGLILCHDVQPAPEWEATIREQNWFTVDECALAWKHFCELHKDWKSEILPGMTGLGVLHVQ